MRVLSEAIPSRGVAGGVADRSLAHGGNGALPTDHGRIDILQYLDRVEVAS